MDGENKKEGFWKEYTIAPIFANAEKRRNLSCLEQRTAKERDGKFVWDASMGRWRERERGKKNAMEWQTQGKAQTNKAPYNFAVGLGKELCCLKKNAEPLCDGLVIFPQGERLLIFRFAAHEMITTTARTAIELN